MRSSLRNAAKTSGEILESAEGGAEKHYFFLVIPNRLTLRGGSRLL